MSRDYATDQHRARADLRGRALRALLQEPSSGAGVELRHRLDCLVGAQLDVDLANEALGTILDAKVAGIDAKEDAQSDARRAAGRRDAALNHLFNHLDELVALYRAMADDQPF